MRGTGRFKIDLTEAPWYGTAAQHVSAQGTGVTTILSTELVLVTGRSQRWSVGPAAEQHADHQHPDRADHDLQPEPGGSGTG